MIWGLGCMISRDRFAAGTDYLSTGGCNYVIIGRFFVCLSLPTVLQELSLYIANTAAYHVP
jgi:hypothetical protein